MKKYLGWLVVSLPFVALFISGVCKVGSSVLIVATIGFGLWLIATHSK